MRHVLFRHVLLSSVLTAFAGYAYAGQQVEAKQDGVKILKDAAKDGAELGALKKGQAVEALDRKGMFWRVKFNGQEGYVSFMQVNRKAGENSALADAIGKAALDSRDMDNVKGARARSAVMGVRGLDESSETASAGSVSPNLRMVYAMEDRTVSEKKIEKLSDLVQKEVGARMAKSSK